MNPTTRDEGFSRVDNGADPRFFIRSLDLQTSLPFYQRYKQRSFEKMQIQKGHRVLDVGCGTGDDVRLIAELVGSQGSVVGTDLSEVMIDEAKKRSADLSLPVDFHVCPAHSLYSQDAEYDSCRADRTFEHLDDPRLALSEMIRVTKKDGRIVVVDPDLDTMVIDAPNHEVVRRFLNFRSDTVRCGWIAHRTPVLFREMGLQDVDVTAMTHTIDDYAIANSVFRLEGGVGVAQERGVLSDTEAQMLVDYWRNAAEKNTFFQAITYLITSGRKAL